MNAIDTIPRPPKTIMEVFENLPEGTLAQIINNQLVISPSASGTYQKVLLDIANRIYNFLEKNPIGIMVLGPFDVYLDRRNAFQPDIIFVSNERKNLISEKSLHGAPDLSIEILSPHTGKYDLDDKMVVYAANGVKEYWIVEPYEKMAKGYWLVEDEFHLFSVEVGVLNSKLLKKKFKF